MIFLKLGFDVNDIENCFIDLNINTTTKFNTKTKRIECINWLIDNSQKKAEKIAQEIESSRKKLRIPLPIKINDFQDIDSTTTPIIITNNFLKEIHLANRHQTKDNDEQEPSLTSEEARIVIYGNLYSNLTNISILGALEEANWDPNLLTALDRTVLKRKYRYGENYRQLVDRLIEQCRISSDDQQSKVRAVVVWITNNIRYATEMSPRDNSKDDNETDMDELRHLILQTSSCVCVGYAVLFKRMCQHLNIQVDYVTGYTKLTKSCINDTANADKIEKLSGHAWTIVHLDGKTYFTDPTWSAARWSSSNDLQTPFTNTYYLVLPRYSIYQFRPHNDDNQHVARAWNINRFINEPCFYPHFFRSKFSLEDRDTEWFCYRLRVELNQQKFMTKSFQVTTRNCKLNSKYRLMTCGDMYWTNDLAVLSESLSQFNNTDYKHTLNAVEFKHIDLNYANNRVKNKKPMFIAELNDIPIYPPKLNVNEIQYGLLKVYATGQSNGHYEPIFECIFEFQ
ncbi:unnamed protein product [Rotaria sp. Silwood2]|nr:unnamed protein product [Rotaria sp. Silwood2]